MKKRGIIAMALLFSLLFGCTSNNTGNNVNTTAPAAEATASPTPEPTAVPTPVIDYTERKYTVDDLAGNYKTQCRTTVISYKIPKTSEKTNVLALDYTAAAVSFNAYCEGTVTAEIFTKPTTIGGNNLYVNVLVDGVKQGTSRKDYRFVGTKVNTVTLAEGLERGMHNFTIERQSEAERGFIYLVSVTMTGEITEKPKDNERFIEFIGDSITTGYGNLYPDLTDGEKDSNQASNVYVDGTRSYACLTAKALSADYSIVAQQGIGVTIGYYPHTMLKTYTNTCYQCSRKAEWGFERKADVVVINMGTNDNTFVRNGSSTYEKVKQGFVDFIRLVREKNPTAKIVWAYGMCDTSLIPYLKEAIRDSGDTNIAFVQLSPDGKGGNGHPCAEAHEKNAEILTKAIKDLMEW